MDIYNFINSKDIRKHLQEISYKFTPVEMAWLIWQCEDATLEEKHKAWQEIIDTMPDVPFETNEKSYDSLHKFLNEYMELENKCIDEIVNAKDDNLFYECSIQSKSDLICRLYLNYESCLHTIEKELLNQNIEIENNICISMRHENESHAHTCIVLNTKGEIMNIYSDALFKINRITFENVRFIFPTPFVKGDILWNPHSLDINPFVLEETHSDMLVWGYSTGVNGQLYEDCTATYMNVEYYNYKLKDTDRVLKVLSDYLKGEMDIVKFVSMYHQIVLENYAKAFEMRKYDDDFEMWEYGDDDENLPF